MTKPNDIFIEYQKLYSKNKEQQPYHFNILDEQQGHIVENSHTNILMKVLAYKNQYGYVFLKDFCETFFPALSVTDFERTQFRREENRIDGLIYKQNEFAIIIENKVNHAGNQPKQLQNYIEKIKKEKNYFNNEQEAYPKIWVMYLTRDGVEKPDSDSIDFMKNKGICYKDSDEDSLDGERYFAASYSDDIYPWLKENVLPMIPYKDVSLKCGLLQYIDFLEGFLGFRTQSKGLENNARFLLENSYGNIQDAVYKNEELKKLYNYVKEQNNEEKDGFEQMKNHFLGVIKRYNREVTKNFIVITKQIFTGQLSGCKQWYDECHITSNFNLYYITIRNSRWPKSIHFEWYALKMNNLEKGKKYNLQLHIEDKSLLYRFNQDEELKKILEALHYETGRKKTKYKYPYSRIIESEKPILEMNKEELTSFLKTSYETCINEKLIKRIDEILSCYQLIEHHTFTF